MYLFKKILADRATEWIKINKPYFYPIFAVMLCVLVLLLLVALVLLFIEDYWWWRLLVADICGGVFLRFAFYFFLNAYFDEFIAKKGS